MSSRARTLKRLLFRLLLAALLLLLPLFVRARFSFFAFLPEAGSTRTEATAEGFTDDPELESFTGDARPAPRTRMHARRRVRATSNFDDRAAVRVGPVRFALVVDFRRVKPKRALDPPYLRPRVVRLLS